MKNHESHCLMKYGVGTDCTCEPVKIIEAPQGIALNEYSSPIIEEKIDITQKNEKTIIAFDATELDNFLSCPQKWHLFHHRRVVPSKTKTYLETGSLLHYLLELYYIEKKNGLVPQEKIEAIIELGRIKSLEYTIELDEAAQIYFQFREYCRYYEDENIIPIHIEEPFMVLLYEDESIKIYITGKPDLIFHYGNGSKVVMDHKKVSRESEISQIRNQFMLYATAMKSDTVVVNKIGFQKTKPIKERFNRAIFIYSPELLEEWKEETIGIARQMIMHEQLQHFPHNRSACEKWDGCFYRRYCTTRPKARDFLIGDGREYRIAEQWDPSAKLEK